MPDGSPFTPWMNNTPGSRRGHRGQVSRLVGRHEPRRDRLFGAADVGSRRASHGAVAVPLSRRDHSVEHCADRREARVAEQNVLIRGALDLDAPRRIPQRDEGDEVVALGFGEGDRIAAVLVGLRVSVDVAIERRRRDRHVGDRCAPPVGTGRRHPAADDVDLRLEPIGAERGERRAETNSK